MEITPSKAKKTLIGVGRNGKLYRGICIADHMKLNIPATTPKPNNTAVIRAINSCLN